MLKRYQAHQFRNIKHVRVTLRDTRSGEILLVSNRELLYADQLGVLTRCPDDRTVWIPAYAVNHCSVDLIPLVLETVSNGGEHG